MPRGKEATLKERYAAALLHLEAARCQIDPTLQACIDREKAKLMTPAEIIGHFDVDHEPIPKFFGGSNHPTNLNPKGKAVHRAKTSKKDSPAMAKTRRILKNKTFVVTRNDNPNATLEKYMKDEGLVVVAWAKNDGNGFKEGKKKWPSRPVDGSRNSKWKKPVRGKAYLRSPQPTSKSR